MKFPGADTATLRHRNALALFDEFVRATVSDPDAATLRGLERRFAERIGIQPSYWSQIKSRSRQIGERLARQFEQHCRKPAGWLDLPHEGRSASIGATRPVGAASAAADNAPHEDPVTAGPRDDDERFIVDLVLSYYRRNPQRARQRLLDLLGEVLMPAAATAESPGPAPRPRTTSAAGPADMLRTDRGSGRAPQPGATDGDAQLWSRTQQLVSPLKKKR